MRTKNTAIRPAALALAVVAAIAAALAIGMVIRNMAGNETIEYRGHGGTFKNTLSDIDTPDPSVVYRDGFYYMTFTHRGADIMVMKSRTLDFRKAERKVVWYPPIGERYSANLWAPELQFLQGKWYIYFAADDGRNENHRMYVLEADTDDPLGAYTFRGQVTDETDKWAIDGLALEYEGKLYFIWSGWEGDVNVQQNTYIAPMRDPLTISGPRVLLSEPTLAWERAGGPPFINEGQAILKKDGRVYLAYSGAGSWTPFYSIGLLTLAPGGDPLNPSDWTKSEDPLMTMSDEAGVYGPGHNSFVASPDGTEDWIVYHATSGIADGWGNRKARAQRVAWGEDGSPSFGAPLSLDTAIAVPSGEGVLKAEAAAKEEGGGRLTFGSLPFSQAGEAPFLFHYRNATGRAAALSVRSNGEAAVDVPIEATKPGTTGYAWALLPMLSGNNEVAVEAPPGAELIALETPRFEAENAAAEGGAEALDHPFASGWGVARTGAGAEASIRFDNVAVPEAGTYRIRWALSNPSEEDVEFEVSANGGRKTAATLPTTERNAFVVIETELRLNAGVNALTMRSKKGQAIVDYADIVR